MSHRYFLPQKSISCTAFFRNFLMGLSISCSVSCGGASTHEAQDNVAADVAQQIKLVLSGELPQSAVNLGVKRLQQ